jgi:hypothetical protein
MFDLQIDKKKKKKCLQWIKVCAELAFAKSPEPERIYVNNHCVFHCSKSKTIHGSTPVQTIMYISITKGLCTLITHINMFKHWFCCVGRGLSALFCPGAYMLQRQPWQSKFEIKFTSCLPMVGGSLRVLQLLPPLNLVAMNFVIYKVGREPMPYWW